MDNLRTIWFPLDDKSIQDWVHPCQHLTMHEPAQKSLIDAGRWRISRGKCLDKVESINRVLLHVVVYERMESNLQPGCHHCQLRQHVSDTHHCLITQLRQFLSQFPINLLAFNPFNREPAHYLNGPSLCPIILSKCHLSQKR